MDDNACIGFLQWALPGLHMRWAGFRKVRNQVCKRIGRRLQALQLQDVAAYQDYLQRHREEWMVLDGLCRVTISRFFRDRLVFSSLRSAILPGLVQRMRARGETALRIWSAGCAAGEEPYSLSILWELDIKCRAFVEHDGEYCLRPSFRQNVKYVCQDVRGETPPGVFDLVLCRNLVFTYFDDELQRRFLRRLDLALQPQGFLVTGIHETLPQDYDGFAAWSQRLGIYQRRS
jgi:chemotaxis protein methyltransferase CheR